MKADDSDRIIHDGATALPAIGGLRLIALHEPALLSRRRAPRRRLLMAVLVERRRTERRKARPGIDGLLRTVLADDWE